MPALQYEAKPLHANAQCMTRAPGKAHPLNPLCLIVNSCLIQIELVVQNDVEAVGCIEIDDKHESIQDSVLRQVAIADAGHCRRRRGLTWGCARGIDPRLHSASHNNRRSILQHVRHENLKPDVL